MQNTVGDPPEGNARPGHRATERILASGHSRNIDQLLSIPGAPLAQTKHLKIVRWGTIPPMFAIHCPLLATLTSDQPLKWFQPIAMTKAVPTTTAYSLDDLKTLSAFDMQRVNQVITDNLASRVELIDQLSQHIIYSGGKRLRPMLVLLSAKACGYRGEDDALLAAVVEFIHTATLLHDDVVDDSDMRRGQETANTIWRNEAAVLVGD